MRVVSSVSQGYGALLLLSRTVLANGKDNAFVILDRMHPNLMDETPHPLHPSFISPQEIRSLQYLPQFTHPRIWSFSQPDKFSSTYLPAGHITRKLGFIHAFEGSHINWINFIHPAEGFSLLNWIFFHPPI
jgi:hypothetical protein